MIGLHKARYGVRGGPFQAASTFLRNGSISASMEGVIVAQRRHGMRGCPDHQDRRGRRAPVPSAALPASAGNAARRSSPRQAQRKRAVEGTELLGTYVSGGSGCHKTK